VLGEEVDTSALLAAAAGLPDLSEDVAEATADAAARGEPLGDAAVQVRAAAVCMRCMCMLAGHLYVAID
jgi:hypothetical protein